MSIYPDSSDKKEKEPCPYSPGIQWERTGPDHAVFCGTGELTGMYDDEEDDCEVTYNCFGSLMNLYPGLGADVFIRSCANTNEWLRCAELGPDILSVQDHAFSNCINLKTLIVHGMKTTIFHSAFYSSNQSVAPKIETIYGHAGSQAEKDAERFGAQFIPLQDP